VHEHRRAAARSELKDAEHLAAAGPGRVGQRDAHAERALGEALVEEREQAAYLLGGERVG
jgi:hypothetical protein